MRHFSTLIAVTSIGLLSACTLFEPHPRARVLDLGETGKSKNQVMVLDATSRLVTVANKKGPKGEYQRIVCSEPSPDGLTAQSAAIAAQGGTQNFGFGFGAASSEAAASIGLRTQTITLLRDGYYRLCEAYMNGVISRESYYIVLAEIDSLMMSLLVIDTVAGAPRAPAVAITPGIPGVSSSLQVSNGGASDTSSGSTGSIAISGSDPILKIETIGAARGALGEYDAKVLLKALDLARGSSRRIQCVMMLADPQFFRDRNQLSESENGDNASETSDIPQARQHNGDNGTQSRAYTLEWALPRICESHLIAEAGDYGLEAAEISTGLQKKINDMADAIEKIGAGMKNDNKELNSAQKKLLELSSELARLAIEKSPIIIEKVEN